MLETDEFCKHGNLVKVNTMSFKPTVDEYVKSSVHCLKSISLDFGKTCVHLYNLSSHYPILLCYPDSDCSVAESTN